MAAEEVHRQDRAEPFRVSRTGAPGLGRGTLRHRRYARPTRGVRVLTDLPLDLETRVQALRLVLPDRAVFCLTTAAELWQLPVPHGSSSVLHVAAPPGAARTRRSGVAGHRLALSDVDIGERCGVPLTTPARTFVDLAAVLSLGDLVALGDALLRGGLASRAQLDAAVRRGRARRGVARARRAADLLDARSASPKESQLRVLLAEEDLPAPTPNGVIVDAAGVFLARGDLVFEEWQVVVEYDGTDHADPRRRESDATRRTLLRAHGWYVVEVTARDLRYPERAVSKVRDALRSRGAVW